MASVVSGPTTPPIAEKTLLVLYGHGIDVTDLKNHWNKVAAGDPNIKIDYENIYDFLEEKRGKSKKGGGTKQGHLMNI